MEENYNLFDRYVRGELPEAEKRAFEERLAQEKAFEEAFMWHKTLIQGIHTYGRSELKKKLARIPLPADAEEAFAESTKQPEKPSAGPVLMRRMFLKYVAAASVLLAVVTGTVVWLVRSENLETELYTVVSVSFEGQALGFVAQPETPKQHQVAFSDALDTQEYRYDGTQLVLSAKRARTGFQLWEIESDTATLFYLVEDNRFFLLAPTKKAKPLEEENNKVRLERLRAISK